MRITSRFGEVSSVHSKPHTGIDIALPEGTPLKSITEGVVQSVVDYGSENIGKGVIVQLADGKTAIYGHLSDIKVKAGQIVKEGDLLGLSGNTGRSTGPHLHFGMKENGQFIDPTKFIENGKVGQVDYFNVWEWLHAKVSEVTVDAAADFIADFALALPIVCVVSAGVYAFIAMLSKDAAKWGAIGTFIYGALMLK
ncbi:M23 family metallopeptidase [Bacillus sp. ISL-37]|uniref:M23 family metallopeptidase n=1 Tax=Bacillus sp. ISL-37 TaxID=2819123 RepID=UPI00336A6C63